MQFFLLHFLFIFYFFRVDILPTDPWRTLFRVSDRLRSVAVSSLGWPVRYTAGEKWRVCFLCTLCNLRQAAKAYWIGQIFYENMLFKLMLGLSIQMCFPPKYSAYLTRLFRVISKLKGTCGALCFKCVVPCEFTVEGDLAFRQHILLDSAPD